MAQRQKVLETDSPTAKFLYTIIKQLDLKSIDWNRVASDLEVSNGHAARMRYSRFRQQMEGTTGAARTKRKQKKAKIVDPPAEMQSMFPIAPTSSRSTMGSMNSSFQISPFIKSEPGTQRNPGLQNIMQYNPQSMVENNMHGQYYFPQDFASMQFQMASSMQSGSPPSSSPATSSSFANPYSSENTSTGYPYSSSGMQSDFDFRDINMQNSCPNLLSTIPWESQVSSCPGGPTIKTEESQQNGQTAPWEPLSSHQPNVMAAASVEQYQPSLAITWGPSFPRYEQHQSNSADSWEPRYLPRQVSPTIKSEEQQDTQIIALEAAPPPENIPAAQVEQEHQNNRDITWDTLPPPPEDTPPAEPEQQLSNAMVIWQPPSLPYETALTIELEKQQDTNMSTEPQPAVSPTRQSISLVNIDEEEHSKEALITGELENQDLFVKGYPHRPKKAHRIQKDTTKSTSQSKKDTRCQQNYIKAGAAIVPTTREIFFALRRNLRLRLSLSMLLEAEDGEEEVTEDTEEDGEEDSKEDSEEEDKDIALSSPRYPTQITLSQLLKARQEMKHEEEYWEERNPNLFDYSKPDWMVA